MAINNIYYAFRKKINLYLCISQNKKCALSDHTISYTLLKKYYTLRFYIYFVATRRSGIGF